MLTNPREHIADFFIHLGWACWGQQCDCGYNPFNWLARFIGEANMDDDWEPVGFSKVTYWIGERFYDLGIRLSPRDSTPV